MHLSTSFLSCHLHLLSFASSSSFLFPSPLRDTSLHWLALFPPPFHKKSFQRIFVLISNKLLLVLKKRAKRINMSYAGHGFPFFPFYSHNHAALRTLTRTMLCFVNLLLIVFSFTCSSVNRRKKTNGRFGFSGLRRYLDDPKEAG